MENNIDIKTIENNYDNLEVLKIVNYLLGVVINDVEYMNDLDNNNLILKLGNNNTIKREDLESLVSTCDTIAYIIDFNNVEGD